MVKENYIIDNYFHPIDSMYDSNGTILIFNDHSDNFYEDNKIQKEFQDFEEFDNETVSNHCNFAINIKNENHKDLKYTQMSNGSDSFNHVLKSHSFKNANYGN
jgi:hypothetical protein